MRAVPPAVDDPGGPVLRNPVPDVSEVDRVSPLNNVHLEVRAVILNKGCTTRVSDGSSVLVMSATQKK